MVRVKYTGLSHYRQLLVADFEKAGLAVKSAITFARHEVVEVSEDVVSALEQLAADEFERVEGDVNQEVIRRAEAQPEPTTDLAAQSEWVQRTADGEQPDELA